MNREPTAVSPPPVSLPPGRKPRRINADYRWTVPKVSAFLEALARSGQVAEAARSVGMGRQSVYRLRARLAGTRFAAAFEGARKQGIRARAAASAARASSRWDGPLIAAYLRASQGDTGRLDGDKPAAQGDAWRAQGDTRLAQGDRPAPKATQTPLDTVTSVPGPTPARGAEAAARRFARGLTGGAGGVVSCPFAKGDP